MNQFKPYQIVVVVNDGYVHFGQVMSYVTPESTVMVRRVPGHPGTLEEMPTTKLREIHDRPAQYRWVHYALVSGRGSFPVDMLRYDHAAPVNFRIDETHGLGSTHKAVVDPAMGFEGLMIAALSKNRLPSWTPARWSSFLWGIKPFRTVDLRTDEI